MNIAISSPALFVLVLLVIAAGYAVHYFRPGVTEKSSLFLVALANLGIAITMAQFVPGITGPQPWRLLAVLAFAALGLVALYTFARKLIKLRKLNS